MCLLKVSQSHGNSGALGVSLGDEAAAEACRALQEGMDAFGLLLPPRLEQLACEGDC